MFLIKHMEDFEIVELYWDRDEQAITETDRKYGKYCRKIAYGILFSSADSEECVNDTYLQTWNSIPPQRPDPLSTYVGRICRNISLNFYEKLHALKRGGGETAVCLDELAQIVSGGTDVEEELDATLLKDAINRFLKQCDGDHRKIFIQRYWYMMPVKQIAKENRFSESRVKMSLLRTREKLKEFLMEEGYTL